MIVDRKGNEIAIGSTVLLRLTVSNFIADSERVNLICAYADRHPGLPDDYRVALSSEFVEVLQPDRPVHHDPPPVSELEKALTE